MVLEFIPGCCLWTPVNGLHLLYHPPVSHKKSVFFNPFSLGGWMWRRSFFSQVLAEESFQSCWILEFREGTSLLCPTLASWRSPLDWEKSTGLSFLQLLSSCCLVFTAGPRSAYLHSLPPLWITSGFIPRINGCFLLHSLGKPASLKISKRTPHSSPLCFYRCKFEMTIKKENRRKK